MHVNPATIAVVGSPGSGKTSLIKLFLAHDVCFGTLKTDSFPFSCTPSPFVTYSTRLLVDGDNTHHHFRIWDCSGDPAHLHVVPLYFRSCRAVVVTFDPTDPSERSYRFAQNVIHDLKDPTRPSRANTIIILVATKIDQLALSDAAGIKETGKATAATKPPPSPSSSRPSSSSSSPSSSTSSLRAGAFGTSSTSLPDPMMALMVSASPILSRAKSFAEFKDVLYFECSTSNPEHIFKMFSKISKACQKSLEIDGLDHSWGALSPPRISHHPIVDASFLLSRFIPSASQK